MTRIIPQPPLPPLSFKALNQIQDIESYARSALHGCGSFVDYNVEKALRILRTCVVASLEAQMTFYSSLATFNQRWIIEITEKTISATIGLVGGDGSAHYEYFEAQVRKTIQEHFEAANSAIRSAPAKKKRRRL